MSLTMRVNKRLNIHVIGGGGTGGYCVSFLARLLAGGHHTIHVYDGDHVEVKNLKRQNFRVEDLDQNKAEALCKRMETEIFECPKMISHDQYVTSKAELLAEILTSLEDEESLVVILAVDNIATRKLVNSLIFEDLTEMEIPVVVLDSGNNDQGGQVALYANAQVSYTAPIRGTWRGMLPTMLQIFPELDKIEDENPGLVMNCADNAESEPQAMMANVRNGELLASIVIQILETHKIPGNLWRSYLLTGDTRCQFTDFSPHHYKFG